MSAATASSIELATIHVRLLDEGVDVWRPVSARRLGTATYEIVERSVPRDERWSFQPGDILVVEPRSEVPSAPLTAVARAVDFDEPSREARRRAG